MTFWDIVVGLFTGDTYFPDNPKREHRAEELASDCQYLIAELSKNSKDIKEELDNLHMTLHSMFQDSNCIPTNLIPSKIEYGGAFFEVSEILMPIIAAEGVSYALEIASVSYLLSTGEIGAAALVELVGLPLAFSVGIAATAGVVAIGVAFGIAAIEGAVKRDQLQKAIHEGAKSRFKLQKAYLISERLCTAIHAMSNAIIALHKAGLDTELVIKKLEEMVENTYTAVCHDIGRITENSLISLDHGRGSWAEEDGQCRDISMSSVNDYKIEKSENEREIKAFKGHGCSIRALTTTSDGHKIISGSLDGTLKIWDTETGEELATFKSESPITSVAVSKDNIIIGGDSGSICVLKILNR
jgi:hypothetical protein